MGIKFRCEGCDKKLHVKAFLAGKRGVCPHCGAKIRIPQEDAAPSTSGDQQRTSPQAASPAPQPRSTDTSQPKATPHEPRKTKSTSAVKQRRPSTAKKNETAEPPEDAISEAPEAVWYVRPPSGGQYGPAAAEIMRRWLNEGRVSGDSLVWREGWEDWRTGDAVFPSLRPVPQPTATSGPAAAPFEERPGEDITVGDKSTAARHVRTRHPSRSNARNVAIVAVLSILCVALLVALVVILRSQG
jgi:hypothetical protein